ncbi:phosphoenolpyruvate carboxylase [Myceligenerans pegani]|uniref:Phosphoenolpyruvate carboxylase n=1 Tax=Myceligenerans pegani TaxID=2776917 RepID=A0ABR9N4P6_9MICO|nr:phosphoenolpyruvate carboxylase [Myceligenerans sp. TRM 65318]MBE1877957.1 phosphoenolpyruvate carboxylase [Myceligenerans sp. TRM 65318]MBE3020228.1 phosphoenolpyruvate carboxylase [Myceligenerans sp. TRM 65318]
MSDTTTARGSARHEIPDPLRDDVRLLGGLLGDILREAGGQELLDDVERLRELTIEAYGNGHDGALAAAAELVDGFTLERAEQVARAFTCYFHLANLAEEFHRVRVLRTREAGTASGPAVLEGTLPEAFAQLTEEVGRNEALRRLDELEFRPVLTAHPTEARRRAISGTIRRIGNLLAERDEQRLGGVSRAENERRLLAEIDTMWRTSPIRQSKPSVLDEVKTIMGVFDAVMVDVFPDVYRRLDDWLLAGDAGKVPPVAKPFVRLGSWIGGDRDGNPNVTADVTRRAATLASEHALTALERVAVEAGRRLTLDEGDTPPSSELNGLLLRQKQMSGELADKAAAASPREPHRAAMLAIADRIAATRTRDADLAYADAEELEQDLRVVQDSLVAAGAPRAAYGDLQRLMWQVQTFGFHLAELEIRQHSQVHAAALEEIRAKGVHGDLSERTTEVLDTFRALGAVQRRYGKRAARRYIVSFTQEPAHLAAVYELAALAFEGSDDAPVIDAIPLFETFADLRNSVDILESMLTLPAVQKRLADNGRRVEVMLGYSDSSKDVGPVSATLATDQAQSRIAEWARRHDITLTLFHGRGGALGRGGGPANRAVLAQPPHSVDGRFKLTEQGEVILARYGDPMIAARHIEQVAAATLLASAPSVEKRNADAAADFTGLAERLDTASRGRFHELVRSEGFPQWFAQVTPLEEVGMLPIGSRPAKRGLSVNSLDDLRAIPWVFSWSQARINLAGWFGLGTALKEFGEAADGGLDRLREARDRWPLFATLLDNVEMSLAKTDERIAEMYLALGDRDDLARMVLDELRLTREWVLRISGNAYPLAGRRVLGRAVQVRSPYVDALSLLQVRALRGLRTGADGEAEVDEAYRGRLQHLLLLTVNGVSAGLQNTG